MTAPERGLRDRVAAARKDDEIDALLRVGRYLETWAPYRDDRGAYLRLRDLRALHAALSAALRAERPTIHGNPADRSWTPPRVADGPSSGGQTPQASEERP